MNRIQKLRLNKGNIMNGHQQKKHFIWIDLHNKIISFKKVEGFDFMCFETDEKRFKFVLERGLAGYRIQ